MEWYQILLLTLLAGWCIFDDLGPASGFNYPVTAGLLAGLIMGEMATGLVIGGSMQLMVLGIGTPGGASKIDAQSGAILGTAFSVAMHMKPEQALTTIAVPAAALLLYTDILGRMANTFFAHKIDSLIENEKYDAIDRWYLGGVVSWTFSRMIPVFFALAFGGGVVAKIVELLNGDFKWLGDGLTLAGGVLPAVGFAILLRFLPAKKHIAYLILGFTITILLSTVFNNIQGVGGAIKDYAGAPLNGLPMLAIALIGGAFAYLDYQRSLEKGNVQKVTEHTESTTAIEEDEEGEITDDEY